MKLKRIMLTAALIAVGYFLAEAQCFIGMRDARYVNAGYSFSNGLTVGAEHSIYSEDFEYQKIRIFAKYYHAWENMSISTSVYGSTLWNRDYQDYGGAVTLRYNLLKIWGIEASINPHYDTHYGYMTCYTLGSDVRIIDNVALVGQYSTIPEYRLDEKRVRVGLRLTKGNLSITPMVSIPVGNDSQEEVRMLCNCSYNI